jgi:hypothetical protein
MQRKAAAVRGVCRGAAGGAGKQGVELRQVTLRRWQWQLPEHQESVGEQGESRHRPGVPGRQHRRGQGWRQQEQRDEGVGRAAGKIQQHGEDRDIDRQMRENLVRWRATLVDPPLRDEIDGGEHGNGGDHRYPIEGNFQPRECQHQHYGLRQHFDPAQHDQLAVSLLQSIPGYAAEFKQVFGSDKIDVDRITQAIAAFEETLVTPNSRFDKWLKGDKKALNKTELEGYALFKDSGCVACRNGAAVGGNSFQKMGVVGPYKASSPAEGRSAVTGKDADRFNFKVPTLRNVELTYPYFHDGAADTLSEAVETMGRVQLGKKFTPEENARIVAFLKTLTGDQPSFKMLLLPPSADNTPRPTPFDK